MPGRRIRRRFLMPSRATLDYAMRLPIRTLSRAADVDHQTPFVASDRPTPGEVLTEIGMLMMIHLAVLLAVTVTLGLFGIA
jgi:hypothetical protein